MPKRNAPEFSFDEKTGLYRKKIKNPVTGKWIPVYGHTKAELRTKIKQREQELALLKAAGEDPFVYQYAARWYKLNTGSVGAKRKEDYKNAINNHICPIIGSKLVREVTYDDALAVKAAAAHLGKSSQRKIICTLRRIFDAAEKNNLIARSPCRDMKAEGKKSEEKVPLTKDQQRRLMAAVKGTKAEAFVALGLYAGLRREEALGLEWKYVHLDAQPPYIEVEQAVSWEGKNKPVLSIELKSEKAHRKIPMPQQLVEILTEQKSKSSAKFVVANSVGEAMSAQSFRKMWDVIRVRSVREITVTEDGIKKKKTLQIGDKVQNHKIEISLDFHVTPHQLRHTYITELILAGAPIKTVQYLAGHATVAITLNIYTHLMENQPADTAGAVLAAFGSKTESKDC